jgi:hypothetical protein
MAILVLVCVAVLVVGITAFVTIPVKHAEVLLVDLYWKRSMQVGRSHWDKRESPRKPRGEVRKVVDLNAGDPEKKPLWAYEERVWEGLHWIHADGHDQQYLHWPEDKKKQGEEVKNRRKLYQASFSADGAGRYAKSLSQRRWERLQQNKKYRLGLNALGSVRTVKPALPAAARRSVTRAQAPATATPSGENSPKPTWPSSGGNTTSAATWLPADGNNPETD